MHDRLRHCLPLLLATWLAACLPGWGYIFDLKPGTGQAAVLDILQPRGVLRDRVTVNGVEGTLDLGVTDLTLAQAVTQVAPLCQPGKAAVNPSALLLEGPAEGQWRSRYYLLSMGQGFKTLVFVLRLPLKAFASKPAAWPRSLPEPRGATPTLALQLEQRGITLASFRADAPPGAVLRDYHGLLQADGWEVLFSDGQTGAVYQLREHLLTFSVGEDGAGAQASLVLRRGK